MSNKRRKLEKSLNKKNKSNVVVEREIKSNKFVLFLKKYKVALINLSTLLILFSLYLFTQLLYNYETNSSVSLYSVFTALFVAISVYLFLKATKFKIWSVIITFLFSALLIVYSVTAYNYINLFGVNFSISNLATARYVEDFSQPVSSYFNLELDILVVYFVVSYITLYFINRKIAKDISIKGYIYKFTIFNLAVYTLIFLGFNSVYNFKLDTLNYMNNNGLYNFLRDDIVSNYIYSPQSFVASEQVDASTNEYSGIFEGKNVVYVYGETFGQGVIDPELTPTLYMMQENGMDFTNYYSVYTNTFFSEMTSMTGASAQLNYENTDIPSGLEYTPQIFKDAGYCTYGYHNGSSDFYNRDLYYKEAGFDNTRFLATEYLTSSDPYYSSTYFGENSFLLDTDLINGTVGDYVNTDCDNFYVNYMTIQGHGPYNIINNRDFVKSNIDRVYEKHPDYTPEFAGYVAANINLDQAMNALITRLSEENLLNDTVIILTGDHYPYLIDYYDPIISPDYVDDPNTTSYVDVYGNGSELYNLPFIIYNPEISPVKIDNYTSNIDVKPTMMSLFGLEASVKFGVDMTNDAIDHSVYFGPAFGNSYVNALGDYRYEDGTIDITNDDTARYGANLYLSMSDYLSELKKENGVISYER